MFQPRSSWMDQWFQYEIVDLCVKYGADGVYVGVPRFTGEPIQPHQAEFQAFADIDTMLVSVNAALHDVFTFERDGQAYSIAMWMCFLEDFPGYRLTQCFVCGKFHSNRENVSDPVCNVCRGNINMLNESEGTRAIEEDRSVVSLNQLKDAVL